MPFSCCVPECSGEQFKKRRFPIKDPLLMKVWMASVANSRMPDDHDKVYKNYRVCDKHFENDCFSPGVDTLNVGAIPTLFLPSKEKYIKSLVDDEHSYATMGQRNLLFSLNALFNEHSYAQAAADDCKYATDAMDWSTVDESIAEEVSVSRPSENSIGVVLTDHNDKPLIKKSAKALSPTTVRLQKVAKTRSKLIKYHKKVNRKLRMQLLESREDDNNNTLDCINPTLLAFMQSQLKNDGKKSRGKRFTVENKILALAFYKQSPKCYRMMRGLLNLPSKSTLNNLLRKIPFIPGVQAHIFAHLKENVAKMADNDKYCSVIFDEIQLSASLHYNEFYHIVEGFEDFGDKRNNRFANHALVFMACGICRRWRQPLAYMFCESTTKTIDLVRLLKLVIKEALTSGLNVIATVCDQNTTNVAAINYLKEETKATCLRNQKPYIYNGFIIADKEVVPLFDPPHLLKGIRNNLLTKDVSFIQMGIKKTATWDDIETFYKYDLQRTGIRSCPKLTDAHCIRNKIKKMKVSCCAQVFSHKVASSLALVSEFSDDKRPVRREAVHTADFLLVMDKLFDSLNGLTINAQPGKPLRCAITNSSDHVRFWNEEALPLLKSALFNNKRPPSLQNFILTIENMTYLWNKLQKEGLQFLTPRSLNQDAIEQYFSKVRSYGVRNVNPDCRSFSTAFKSLVLNSWMTKSSPMANCENDFTEEHLNNLQCFITKPIHPSNSNYSNSSVAAAIALNCQPFEENSFSSSCTSYVAGYICRQVLKTNQYCEECQNVFVSNIALNEHALIRARDYGSNALVLPVRYINEIVNICWGYMTKALSTIVHLPDLDVILKEILLANVDFSMMVCKTHDIQNVFLKYIIKTRIHSYCKDITQRLTGKESRGTELDNVQKNAVHFHFKHKPRK